MASISSLGVGSNLDLNSLLDKLESAEKLPLVQLQRRQASYTAKLSAYGTVRDALATLQSAAQRLADAKLFQGLKASVSASDVLTVSASASAPPGSYSVEVLQLAQSQSLASLGVADPKAPIGKGVLTLDFGRISGGSFDAASGHYSGAAFTPDAAHAAQSLTLTDANNSLEGLRDAINQATGLGVVASIVHDGSAVPYRLVLASKATGEQASLRVSVAGDASLAALVGHDPAGTQALVQTAAAGAAQLKVNGLAIRSDSNTVQDALQGTTLTLGKTGASQVAIARDNAAVESAAAALVSAYNALLTTTRQLTQYDAQSKSGAALVGDAAVRQLQSALRSALTQPQGGSLATLTAAGLGFQKDGTLALDSGRLRSLLASDRPGLARLFAGDGTRDGAAQGLGQVLARWAGEGGLLQGASEGVKATLKSLDGRYDTVAQGIQAKMARYRAQFQQLDQFVSRMNATTSYLSQQFENMAGSKK